MNVDGNMAALARYEREQDRLQRMDDELERIEGEIWEQDALLIEAVRAGDETKSIDTAVESYARVLLEAKRERNQEF